ncbi:MAG TPA: hypothetical protein VGF13_16210 [Verrucomicrobiae bacterium]|jgi:hypothetical protein
MDIARTNPRGTRRGKTLHPTLAQDALVLGVNPSHLWRVINGKRHSDVLLRRYRALEEIKAGLRAGKTITPTEPQSKP